MKKTILPALLLMLSIGILPAQAPQFINYQAVARNAQGQVLPNQTITVRLTIHANTPSGATAYTETDTVTTNQFGLFTVAIGKANTIPGGFAGIAWGSGSKFLQVELDPAAGFNFSDMGTTQLLSVPYALHAETSADNSWLKNGNDIYNGNSGKVGIGTSSPNASAALDISSTNGALLLPRLTTVQRDALSPVAGMVIYNTDSAKFQGYAATTFISTYGQASIGSLAFMGSAGDGTSITFTAPVNGRIKAVKVTVATQGQPGSIDIYDNHLVTTGPSGCTGTAPNLLATTNYLVTVAGVNTYTLLSPLAVTANQKVYMNATEPSYIVGLANGTDDPATGQYRFTNCSPATSDVSAQIIFETDGFAWVNLH